LMPIVGAVADRFGRKREMLLTFGFLGAASCVGDVVHHRVELGPRGRV